MNCLNRVEIQEYIDNEVTAFRKEEIHNHLSDCRKCSDVYEEALGDLGIINDLLDELDRNVVAEPFRVFGIRPAAKKRWFSKYVIEILLAASVLLFILLIRPKRDIVSEAIQESEILRQELIRGQDLNKMWREGIPADLIDENSNPINPL